VSGSGLVGLAGPLERARLVRMAAASGVADSARFLAGHRDWLIRLGVPGGYSPERFLERAAGTLGDPALGVAGLHVFTFNQLRQTEEWRAGLVARLSPPGRRAAG
jgi:methylenetetrahydrofolate reductase (NADPH)